MRKPISVPGKMMPTPDPVDPCPCQFKPVRLYYKQMQIFWSVKEGQQVERDQILCSGEIEKKTLDIRSPYAGTLCEICAGDGSEVTADDVIGYIEVPEAD